MNAGKSLASNSRKKRRRMVVYDFDGTLFNSPDRATGQRSYLKATGKKFPFPGWWGRLESLLPPVVPQRPGSKWLIETTVSAYRHDSLDKNTELILMTGRPAILRKRVLEICELHDLKFHTHFFRDQQNGIDTLEMKSNYFTEELINDGLELLEIWEDRPEHVAGFCARVKPWKMQFPHLQRVLIHDAVTGTVHEL